MKNLLKDKSRYFKIFANDVYNEFRKMKYGINYYKNNMTNLDLSIMRKEIIDWQSNADNEALTQSSINYWGWLPVTYTSIDSSVFVNNQYTYLKSCASSSSNLGLSYNYGVSQNQNIIDVNTAGCVTRINLNPAVTINNTSSSGSQYTFNQTTPSAIWTINHSLGFVPNVYTVDNTGANIIGTINSSTTSTLVLSFSKPVSGYAYLS
jgi:hypothetical protein